jgi:hypothetical protein
VPRSSPEILTRLGSEVEVGRWTTALVVVALLQVAAGVAGFLWGAAPDGAVDGAGVPDEIRLLALVAFGGVGVFLVYGGNRDRRAVYLGVAFLLIATFYADRLIGLLEPRLPGPGRGLASLLALFEVGAFLPAFLWLFVRHFPDSPGPFRQRRAVNAAIRLAIAAGAVLFAANLLRVEGVEAHFLAVLQERRPTTAYPAVLMLLSLAAFAAAAWRARSASGAENRRFRLFLAALVAGLAPIALQVLLEELIPAYERHSLEPAVKRRLSLVLFPLMFSVPFTTAYAVLVHRVLAVRLIARRALQYALARFSALLLAAVPAAALVGYLFAHRDQSLAELASGGRALLLIAAAVAGAGALHQRQALLDAIDRRFFREQYDARQLLTLLVEQLRASRDVRELAALIARGIDRALHLETIGVLIEDPGVGALVDPEGKTASLDASSPLALLTAANRRPLEVDLDHPRAPARHLPAADRGWLAASGFHLLVPILSTDGTLIGAIALGGKRSGLPFLADDRELLTAVASSAALALDLRRAHGPAGGGRPGEAAPASGRAAEPAGECPRCGKLSLLRDGPCPACGGELAAAAVPFVLPGRFRFEQRIGSGGMGVVYRATDLALGRHVAIKTLRRLAPKDAARLRREARTAAAVSHPNLAAVYGVETWSGTPLLIMELLERGTLRDRIERGRLDPGETVRLGTSMAGALAHLHSADILHRDIKPSNIGFAPDQTPKLMDFGIARLSFDLRADGAAPGGGDGGFLGGLGSTSIWNEAPLATTTGGLTGTLPYLSPEAAQGMPADAGADLWSLAAVLYECLSGETLFTGADSRALLLRIACAEVPDLRARHPEWPEPLQRFFAAALHRDRARRPATAAELGRRLAAVGAELE